ncbi:MAG: hypothetical protein GPJ01_11050 [Microcystis aeruginosa LL13-06]|jgi:predicted neutral ceramidase superfamily lipid hydrolase|uniref:hypothetical protein n=1 Tax=Microcystis sp. LSC13-02 TaxID=1895004 RepID=UPI00257DC673|nr:hypothetical protein [Microcystis sp. LSC13-02]NCR58290.1 hypothetical protein [Microcystis aeruginosa LL13-06]
MIDFNTLAEFSRNYCISICAFLVPANLVTTVLTVLFLYFGRPTRQIFPIASLALLFAVTMFLHVSTWLMIGVVMAPTFILFGLGLTCFVINFQAISDRQSLEQLLHTGVSRLARSFN